VTYPDPDHSGEEIGRSARHRVLFLSHTRRGGRTRLISGRKATNRERKQYEENISEENNDDLRAEYDLSQLKGGVRGKYYREASAGTNLVLIDARLIIEQASDPE
jgi:hypothetical protein